MHPLFAAKSLKIKMQKLIITGTDLIILDFNSTFITQYPYFHFTLFNQICLDLRTMTIISFDLNRTIIAPVFVINQLD